MPATSTSYQLYDWQKVKAILAALTPAVLQSVASTGWVDFFEANEAVDPDRLQPTDDPANPRIFARWAIVYLGEPDMTLDPDAAPVRDGLVRIALRYQPGTLYGPLLLLWQRVREEFKAQSVATDLAFFPESPVEPRDPQAGWQVEELPIRFTGV